MTDLLAYLLDSLTSLASTLSTSVYLERAPENATFPYITWSLSNSFEMERREDYIMDVNIWENRLTSTTMTQADRLLDKIDGNGIGLSPSGLNRRRYYAANKPAVRLYRIGKQMIPDPDEAILRRRLRYRCIVFDTTSS